MSKHTSIPVHSMLVFAFVAAFALPAPAATDARVSERYGKLPLHFEANRGQTHKDVRFLSHGPGYSLYLTAGEAVLVLSKSNADAGRDARSAPERGDAQMPAKSVALRVSLVGAAHKPLVSGLEELPGKANYFIGRDRSKWRTNVPTYAKVQYREVYPGVDLVYYGNQRQLEYDFVLAPGADPNRIVLGFKGADKLEIDAEGSLVLHASGGDIRQDKPVIYQNIDGVRRDIAGGYVRKGANRVGFQVAAYDTRQPLVIDPVVLSYSTYLGGSAGDSGNGIAVDADGNAYVTGDASSIPTTAGAFQTTNGGRQFAFVTKINSTGSALVYSTYLGSGVGNAIAVDADGNAYATGIGDSDFPTTTGAFQPTGGGVFVTKLNPAGSALIYSTFLRGSNTEVGMGIAVDANRNAYVTGYTSSTDFPTTPGAIQTTFGGGELDAFVTKLDPSGSALVYSSYLGGGDFDSGLGIAVDAAGNAYITGATISTNFPTTQGAFQPVFGGGSNGFGGDAYVAKLNPTGSAFVYSTYLGGTTGDSGAGIAADADGNAYVTGQTTSNNFPTTAGAFQPILSGPADAFVTKLGPGGAVVYSTCLGGTGGETGRGIAVDSAGNTYVIGSTNSSDFPTTPAAFQPIFGGGGDVFVTKLNPSGSALAYSTYLGGSDFESGFGVAVDTAGNAYVTGRTSSSNFPTTAGAFQPTQPMWFGRSAAPPPAPTGTGTTRFEESAATEIGFWTSYGAETGTFSGGAIVASDVIASTAMFSFTGTAVSWIGVKCNVCGIAAVSIDGGAPVTVNTAGPGAPGGLTSEPVFSASGLAAASHTIFITVTGTSSSGGSYVAVDAFDVTAGSATSPLLPSVGLPPPPVVVPPLPPILGL